MVLGRDRIYVAPEFKRFIKVEAAKEGKDVVEFTRDLIKKGSALDALSDWNNKVKRISKRGFDYP